jgi:nucleoside-diphosphate-sugar epimerase
MIRAFVTGGAGFIGRSVVRRLVERGDRVIAVVRDIERAGVLRDMGVELRASDLGHAADILEAMRGADVAIHLAGSYRVGIADDERPAMLDANVGATVRLLEAAAAARLERVVAISTVNVFGDTHERIVDERYRRDLAEGFLSYYDETKYLAHQIVEERIGSGAPIVIAMPGVTHGPGDHSAIGAQLEAVHRGTARYLALDDVGISAANVEDVAAGIVAALDRGRVGESYVIGGQNVRLRDALAVAAELGGHRLPSLRMPTGAIRALAALPRSVAGMAGLPPNLGEVIDSSAGVTYWASSAKAAAELGYHPHDLATGLRLTFALG